MKSDLTVDTDTGELLRAHDPLTPRELVIALESYRGLQAELDKALPDGLMHIQTKSGQKTFRTKAYWRAIARAFRLRVDLVGEHREVLDGVVTWFATYRASTPDGDSMTGDGASSATEKMQGQDSEHNIRAHAHTRAKNRAIADLVGFGEVSAEEVDRAGSTPAAPAVSAKSTPVLSAPATVQQLRMVRARLAHAGLTEQDLCQHLEINDLEAARLHQVDLALRWITNQRA